MDQFEFFFTFYGVLLGLALAELLLGFANLLRERVQPKWGLLTPLVGLLVLVEISATFLDAWRKLQGIELSLAGFAVPTLIGIAYFVAAVMTVPRQVEDWPSLDDYFFARRRWIAGLLIAANLLHGATELPFLARADRSAVLEYLAANTYLFGAYTVLLVSSRRWLSIAAVAAILLFFAVLHGAVATKLFSSG
jgi:hypothetical protein